MQGLGRCRNKLRYAHVDSRHDAEKTIAFPGYIFYKDGLYGYRARYHFGTGSRWQTEVYFAEPLPHLDTGANFAHAVLSEYRMLGGYYYAGVWNDFSGIGEEVVFQGDIWVLVDGRTAATAEAAVAMLKYNNIATIVGEPTFGTIETVFDPSIAWVSLPSTGIIIGFDTAYFTCPEGRPLQGYGIIPHYFNLPGMDALETVLAMIDSAR